MPNGIRESPLNPSPNMVNSRNGRSFFSTSNNYTNTFKPKLGKNMSCSNRSNPYVVVSLNRGTPRQTQTSIFNPYIIWYFPEIKATQYRTQSIIFLIMGTPNRVPFIWETPIWTPKKEPPNRRKVPYANAARLGLQVKVARSRISGLEFSV